MGWNLVAMVLVGVLALLFGRGPLRWMFLAFIFGFWVLPILAFLPSRRFKYPGEAVTYGSRVFMYGTQCGPTVTFDLVQAVRRHVIIHPYSLYNHVNDPASLERGIKWLAEAIDSGKFKPVIDTVFPWKRALESYEYMQENKHVGKIVVSLIK